jgi:hypothetical protein
MIDDIVDQFIQIVTHYRYEHSSGWSKDDRCLLPSDEKSLLDIKSEAPLDLENSALKFSLWMIRILNRSKKFRLAEAEVQFIKSTVSEQLHLALDSEDM